MTTKEFFVSKLTFRDDISLIRDVYAYEYDGNSIDGGQIQDRPWMVKKMNEGSKISIINPDPNKKDNWVRGDAFIYTNGYFQWGKELPLNSVNHKTFVSYYHNDDQAYKEKFENIFGDLVISKSVEKDDIDSDNSDEYIKQLIQKDYLADTTVLAVLVGPKTKCRKHVDWEIAGAISSRVGGNSGLIGILLPNHPDFGSKSYDSNNLPTRLAANLKSGYAILRDWTEDRVKMQKWIDEAFSKKNELDKRIMTSIPQMQKNTCE